jgi:hypothetical protein
MSTYLENRPDKTNLPGRPVPIPAEKARQGRLGRPVLVVLVSGLVLTMIAWAIAGFYGESADDDSRTTPAQVTMDKPAGTPANQAVQTVSPQNGQAQMAPVDRDPTAQSGTGGPSQIRTPTGTEKTR